MNSKVAIVRIYYFFREMKYVDEMVCVCVLKNIQLVVGTTNRTMKHTWESSYAKFVALQSSCYGVARYEFTTNCC